MRGKDDSINNHTICIRITPAYAGKSGRVCGLKICRRDHPRLCGEKCIGFLTRSTPYGSPPPMRGKAEPMQIVMDLIRITPAYAGKSR